VRNPGKRGVHRMMIMAFSLFAYTFVSFSHHSLAVFDRTRETQYRATVTSFDWANPHASLHARVEAEESPVTAWVFELPSPSGLERFGWTAETLHVNDTVLISAYPARDGSRKASVHRVVLSNGRTMKTDHPFAYPDYR
jgi:hypothetical protein